MKFGLFRGRIPRLASRLLPDEFAEVCTNARLKSGDLEAWRANTVVDEPSKSGTINAIYPLDLYGRFTAEPGPVWLHWTTAEGFARVARGFAKPPSDASVKERIYIAGLATPQVTDIPTAQDGAGTDFPLSTYRLGVRAPDAAPVAEVEVAADPEVDFEYDGADLGGWTTSADGEGATAEVASGEFVLTAVSSDERQQTVAYMARDDGFGAAYYSRMRCVFSLDDTGGAEGNRIIFSHSATQEGRGLLFAVFISPGDVGRWAVGAQDSWGNQNVYTPQLTSGSMTYGVDYHLQVEITNEIQPDGSIKSMANYRLGTTAGAADLIDVSVTNAIRSLFGSRSVGRSRAEIFAAGESWYGFSTRGLSDEAETFIARIDSIETAIAGNYFGDDTESTRYAYTWVNLFGEESAPSPLSNIVPVAKELTLNVSDIDAPSAPLIAEYGIVGKRLYRAVTGDGSTVLRLVADQVALPNATTTFADDQATEDLSRIVLESADWIEPPAETSDICALANGIMLLASGSDVYPSVAFRPHAYVQDWARAADYPVVGMLSIENQAIVLTEECPYLIRGDDPSAMSMDKISSIYGCASRASIVRWKEYGVCYSSFDGMIAVTANGARNLTDGFFTREEWSALAPESMVCAVYDEILFVFYDNGAAQGGFTFDVDNGVVDLSFYASAVYVDPLQDRLFMLVGGDIVEFNTGDKLTATWRSGIRQLPHPMSFSIAQVRAPSPSAFLDTVNFAIFRDGEAAAYFTAAVNAAREFRVRVGDDTLAEEIQAQLSTSGKVNSVEIEQDVDDLE